MLGQQQGKGVARLVAWSLALLLGIFSCAAHTATVQYVYDELGRLIAEIDPASDTTRYTYDAAGNLLSVSRGSSAQLSILSFSPTSGPIGTAVSIFGSGFIANPAQNTVSFGSTTAVVTTATSTALGTTVPVGAVTGPITVSNTNGNATSSQAFIVLALPTITAVSPNVIAQGATTRADISGAFLASATVVTFAQSGITASILPGDNDQLLPVNISVSASVPAGSYSFSVTNPAGTTNSGSVTVTVAIPISGASMTVTPSISVFLPSPEQSPPPVGGSMSVTPPVSVYLPPPGAPSGAAMSVTQPVSVSMP